MQRQEGTKNKMCLGPSSKSNWNIQSMGRHEENGQKVSTEQDCKEPSHITPRILNFRWKRFDSSERF